ncbi:hypothetical protein [Botryobacter ruber]|uniref:hypothetical protein n=1 Tax=Botryobacter ruber TaxID=2171629 RepID=UPI000F64AF3B|nr:hypothetical protein [Botryobacter ruber]
MEAIILYLLLLFGLPVGNANQASQQQQESTAAQVEKTKGKTSNDPILHMQGGTGTWGENGVISEPGN